jgi:hypothetical protein
VAFVQVRPPVGNVCWQTDIDPGAAGIKPPKSSSVSWLGVIGRHPQETAAYQREALATLAILGWTPMDRLYLAIIVSALLLFLGAAGLYVTKTADLMPHARTVGFSGSK